MSSSRRWFKQDYGLPEPAILTLTRREGRAEGRAEGQATITLRQLTRRFGALPEPVVAQVRGLGSAGLLELADALLDFTEYRDLTDWLAVHHSATMHAE